MQYIVLGLISFGLSLAFVPLIKKWAFKLGIVDLPDEDRKIHTAPTPLLGGFAIYIAFVISIIMYLKFGNYEFQLPMKFYSAMVSGGLVLMLGGFLDDKYSLKPYYQILFPALAALIIVSSGIGVGIKFISNPFGEPISLDFLFIGIPFSAIFIFFYILGMIYTTKFLDGMDGLAVGIGLIAGLTLFFLSLAPRISQPITASIAIIFCGAVLGFLIYNFNPASIFLGESGSTFVGFILGTLSVLLGGKIATTLLVMGIPILDVAWVIARRVWYGASPFKADRKHLHFRLLDIGFSQKQTVLILYAIAASFGFVAVFLQTLGKLISLVLLVCVMIFMALSTVIVYKRKNQI